MAHLSTHVLDTARGIPAKGMRIDCYRIENGERRRVATGVTNADGRIAAPLISGELLEVGVYELVFHAGEYLRAQAERERTGFSGSDRRAIRSC